METYEVVNWLIKNKQALEKSIETKNKGIEQTEAKIGVLEKAIELLKGVK